MKKIKEEVEQIEKIEREEDRRRILVDIYKNQMNRLPTMDEQEMDLFYSARKGIVSLFDDIDHQ